MSTSNPYSAQPDPFADETLPTEAVKTVKTKAPRPAASKSVPVYPFNVTTIQTPKKASPSDSVIWYNTVPQPSVPADVPPPKKVSVYDAMRQAGQTTMAALATPPWVPTYPPSMSSMVGAPIGVAPVIQQLFTPPAPAPVAPAKKLPSLKAFVASDQEIEGSIWTNDLIAECLTAELWRARDVDETVREADLMLYSEGDGAICYERVSGYKDAPLTQEMIDLHGLTIYTLEGGGKPRKPVVIRSTTEFKDLMSVPKGVQMRLPVDENEAKRFFGCEVIITELIDKGKPTKCFYPVPQRMSDKAFRCAFSRVFPDFAKKHFREYIKGLIVGRGEGVRLKRGLSIRKIIDMVDGNVPGTKAKVKPLTVEEVSMKINLPVDTINQILARRDYQLIDRPTMPFIQRMDARQLTPADFKYDKALGIEIETVTPLSHEQAQKRVPNYVRCAQDGSIRDNSGNKPNGNGVWGIEYRILIKRSELDTRVFKAVEAISNMGASVNKSCGLHVHFDMRDKTKVDAAAIHDKMSKWVSVLRELVPASRRANQYCMFEGADSDHHRAVSFGSYDKHRTIEVRVHSATLNNIKIIQWVRLMEAIIETKFAPMAKTSTLDGLKMLNLPEADRTYWLKRHQQLNPDMYKAGFLDLSFLGAKSTEIE